MPNTHDPLLILQNARKQVIVESEGHTAMLAIFMLNAAISHVVGLG